MEQKEKLRTVTAAMKESLKKQMNGDYKQKTVNSIVEIAEVEKITQDWPESSKIAIEPLKNMVRQTKPQ